MKKNYLTPTFIKTFCLVLAFVVLASILIIVDRSKVINVDKHFDSDITVTYLSAESETDELVTVTQQLTDLKGKDMPTTNYHSIILTCKEDITYRDLTLKLTSENEQTVDIKVYCNNETVGDNTSLLVKSGKTSYYKLSHKLSLSKGDSLKIEFVSQEALHVSSFGLCK